MTLAFIITAVVAGIMFFLWISARESLTEAEGKILQLDKHIQEIRENSGRITHSRHTELTKELTHDVIRDNGFVPHQDEEDWISFKKQGELYLIGIRSVPHIQFYKGYRFDNEYNLDILKQSAKIAMEELGFGRIHISEDAKHASYRVFGVEKTVEHFSESFNEYMGMVDDLVACHMHFYHKMMEQNDIVLDTVQSSAKDKNKTILS